MKKRKKYNPCKSIIEKSQSIINSTAVALILGDKTEYVDLIPNDFKSFELTHVYLKPRHLWTVALTILRVNEKGEQCLTVHHVQPPSKCKADEIGDSVNKTLKMMIDKCDNKEFLAAGYVAIARDEFISSKKIESIFDGMGVWRDYKTDNGYVMIEDKNQFTDNIGV